MLRWLTLFVKSKKKKKAAVTADIEASQSPRPETPAKEFSKPLRNIASVAQPKNEKKALKKAKARERKAGRDEFDQALAELSVKYVLIQSNHVV